MIDKVRENRLRRSLSRAGYQLMKSRARDPLDLTYGGYQVIDRRTRQIIAGNAGGLQNEGRGYAMKLNDLEAWYQRFQATVIRLRHSRHEDEQAQRFRLKGSAS